MKKDPTTEDPNPRICPIDGVVMFYDIGNDIHFCPLCGLVSEPSPFKTTEEDINYIG